jgi:cell wall assembly regulator SMI1
VHISDLECSFQTPVRKSYGSHQGRKSIGAGILFKP